MEIFLLPNEIETLTGYKRKSEQRMQLSRMGIPFQVNRLGKPVVVRAVIERKTEHTRGDALPDLDALTELEDGTQTTH